MKKKTTRKSLLMSAVSMFLCISMFIGTTFAWFTDSVSSGTNKIVAGNLDIDLVMDKNEDGKYVSIANEDGAIFGGENSLVAQNKSSDTLWEPGKTQIVYLGVQNKGTLALKYNILLKITDGGLADALDYAIVDGATKAAFDAANLTTWEDIKALSGVQTGNLGGTLRAAEIAGQIKAAEGGVLDECVNGTKNETDYFALAIHMDENAGNTYMKNDITIDVNVTAVQYTAESDSFDNQYDKQEKPECLTFTCVELDEGSDWARLEFYLPFEDGVEDIKDNKVQFKASSTGIKYGPWDGNSASPVTDTGVVGKCLRTAKY